MWGVGVWGGYGVCVGVCFVFFTFFALDSLFAFFVFLRVLYQLIRLLTEKQTVPNAARTIS